MAPLWKTGVCSIVILGFFMVRQSFGFRIPGKFDKKFFEKVYDQTIRPGAPDNNATVVTVHFHVNTIGSISGISMDYSLDIYFLQSWVDKRLEFNGTHRITLSPYTHKRIWWPDTYFYNAKGGLQHAVTMKNEFVHLEPDGKVSVSQRFSLLLSCFMDLHVFPMDTQECYLIIGSYGYTHDEVRYAFRSEDSATFSNAVMLPEFKIDQLHVKQEYSVIDFISGEYSTLTYTFYLERDFGYYLIQTYIPSIMVVILSWVNFWLDVHATPARISLGLLTVLTMSTQISGINAQLPRVSYIKAIDVWMSTCLIFVFGALLEFAVVNVVTRREDLRTIKIDKKRKIEAEIAAANEKKRGADDDGECKEIKTKEELPRRTGVESALLRILQRRRDALKIKNARRIEKICRLAFPVSFAFFVLFYWLHYWCNWFGTNSRCSSNHH